MSYIDKQVEKIQTVLELNGCSLYPPDMTIVRKIIAEAIIASNLDSSLVQEATKLFED